MQSMKPVGTWGLRALMGGALLLSPVVLILGLPLAIGLGFDVFEQCGRASIILVLCLPLLLVVLHWLSIGAWVRRAAAKAWSLIDHAAHAIHAP